MESLTRFPHLRRASIVLALVLTFLLPMACVLYTAYRLGWLTDEQIEWVMQ
jgi:hypothetical protein